jgi:hypothetical protein
VYAEVKRFEVWRETDMGVVEQMKWFDARYKERDASYL